MSRLKQSFESPDGPPGGLGDSAPELKFDAASRDTDFLWRYHDRAQGRFVNQSLPNDLINALHEVATKAIDPFTTLGGSPDPRVFSNVNALLAFLTDHVIRTEDNTNRRNTRFAPDTRRSYSFRLPSELRHFFDIQRPVTINPYTGQPFANVSQMIVFCLHVFVMAEPWQFVTGRRLWLENSAVSKPVARKTGVGAGSLPTDQTNAGRDFERIAGMSQLQVRIDSSHYDALLAVIKTLAPDLSKNLKYRLTMSGLWITAATWASTAIDWSANPLIISDFPSAGTSRIIDWREMAPQGLLVAT
jgi:hypothetical protein